MATIGTINIVLSAVTTDFDKNLARAVKVTKDFGKDLEEIGKAATAAITVPLAGAATAAVASAMKIDEALDQVRASTGAMGADMEQLGTDLRAVLGTVPNSVDQVSDAISGLNQRLDLSGEPLQAMATQMLNLARLTGTEVGPLIESTTRLFGDWSVATEKQSGTLDLMFRASQQSGVGIDRLSQLVTQFGAPMRQMGFSLEESAGLLAKFEKEGVNTELVMGSMRIALTKLAKEGVKDTATAFVEITDRIKSAGSAAEANKTAMELFGAKAGPDMAAAIREGRFEIEEFLKRIQESPDSINKAAQETMGFAEQMEVMRNQVTLALEPIGVRLIAAFEQMLPAITAVIDKVAKAAEWFANLSPAAQQVGLAIAGIAAAIGPVALTVGSLVKSFAGLAGAMGGVGGIMGVASALTPVLIALGAAFVAIKVTGFISDLMTAQDRMKEFKDNVGRMALELKMKFGLEIKQGVGESLEDFEKRLSMAWNEAERFAKEVEQISPSMRSAKVSVDETKTGLEKYTVSMGGAGKANKDTAGSMTVVTDEARKQSSELQKLKDSFEKASAPMNALAQDYARLEKAGVSFDDILEANVDAIFKASQTQLSHGQALTSTALKYAEAAAAIKNNEQNVAAFDAVMQSFSTRAQADLAAAAKAMIDTGETFEKVGAEIVQSIDFADAVQRSQDDVKDYLDAAAGYYVISEEKMKAFHDLVRVGVPIQKAKDDTKDLEKTWLQSVSTMTTDWAKATTDMIFEGKSFFETLKGTVVEFGKSMVRGLLESVMGPLQQGLTGGLKNILGGIFGGGKDGGGGGLGGIFSGIAGGFKKIFGGLFGGKGGLLGGLFGGGGAGGLGGIFSGLLGSFAGPLTGLAMGGIKALGKMFKGMFSKSSIEKAIKEAARDLGGVQVGKDAMKSFMSEIGLDEKGLENIRKDIAVSPKFLVDIAAPMAEAQGKTEAFLKSLEAVGTAWGTFNFREAFQIGQLTGDFTMLNEAFVEAFSKSQNLQAALPNFAEVLAAAGREANGLYTELMNMGAEFQETGVLTDEFAARIGELGGNMEIFQAATELPGLKGALATFTDLKAQVDEFLPKQEELNEGFIETGVVSEELAKQIEMAGGNLEAFQKFAEVKAARDSLDDLVAKFKETGVVSEELTRIIQTFGSEGVRAMEITGDNIDHVADIMEWDLGGAMRNAAKTLSDELEKMNKTLEEQIGFLTDAIVRSMNAMVYAMAGMNDKAREIMDQLNADFEAFKPKVEVEVGVDEGSLEETRDQIIDGIPEVPPVFVDVTSNVDEVAADIQQTLDQIQAAVPAAPAAPAAPTGVWNPWSGTIMQPGGGGGGVGGAGSIWALPDPRLLGGYQRGGMVPETGPYMLHAGERVVAAGGGEASPITVNLNPQIVVEVKGSEQTGPDIARELARLMPGILERNARGFATKLKRELGLPTYGGGV